MIIGSISEDLSLEKRVAITPDNVKKFIGLGLKVLIEKNYAGHLGIDDEEYLTSGAEISEDKKKILTNSNFILQFNLPSKENLNFFDKKNISSFPFVMSHPSTFFWYLWISETSKGKTPPSHGIHFLFNKSLII